jgi:hypothetical protein
MPRDRKPKHGFECVGFLFINGRPNFIDPDDYLDFRDMLWSKETLEFDLERGVMPPGMLVKANNGTKVGVVVGNYNEKQRVEILGDLLTVTKNIKKEPTSVY